MIRGRRVARAGKMARGAGAASGKDVGGGLRPEDVIEPPVKGYGILAGMDASAIILGECDPDARDEPEQRVALALEFALLDAALEDLLNKRGKRCRALSLSFHDQRLQRPPHRLA